jgi:hypothetical protein
MGWVVTLIVAPSVCARRSESVMEVGALSFFQQHMEAPSGNYPATLAFVGLLEALISSGTYQVRPLSHTFAYTSLPSRLPTLQTQVCTPENNSYA